MSSVHTQAIGSVLLITIDHPPINATSQAVRADPGDPHDPRVHL
jgi:hypothetical protein